MKVPLARPTFTPEMRDAAVAALENEFFVMGESVAKFEEEFARFVGTKHAVAVSSGTAALHLSLLVLGVGADDVVLTTPASFVATANAVLYTGAEPHFADVDATRNIDPADVGRRIRTCRPKALVPVHLYGYPCDFQRLGEACGLAGVPIVEDACQAHGAARGGLKAGAWGELGCFSFYSTKNMTVGGDGGMVTTNDDRHAALLRKLRDCGRTSQYEHDVLGYTARLNTVNCAIGRVQLRHLDGWNSLRRERAAQYRRRLSHLEGVTLPPEEPGATPVYHLFVVETERRDELRRFLGERGVGTGAHYPVPIHLQPLYRQRFGYAEGAFPRSELLSRRALSLPMFAEISPEQVDYVCECIEEFFK